MIVVESTHWPLVAVGSVPDGSSDAIPRMDDGRLWATSELRIVLVVAGTGARACAHHKELVRWLECHRVALNVSVAKLAWVIEDDIVRQCVEAWQSFFGDVTCQAEAAMFGTVRAAMRWLLCDVPTMAIGQCGGTARGGSSH